MNIRLFFVLFSTLYSLNGYVMSPSFEWKKTKNGQMYKQWTITNEMYLSKFPKKNRSVNKREIASLRDSKNQVAAGTETVSLYFESLYGFSSLSLEDLSNGSNAEIISSKTSKFIFGSIFKSSNRSLFTEISIETVEYNAIVDSFKQSNSQLLGIESGFYFGENDQISASIGYSDYQFISINDSTYTLSTTSLASVGLAYRLIHYDGKIWNGKVSAGCSLLLGAKNYSRNYIASNGRKCELGINSSRKYTDKDISIGFTLENRDQDNSFINHQENKVLFNMGFSFDI